jgi:predicted GNAT family N-acyltransferase
MRERKLDMLLSLLWKPGEGKAARASERRISPETRPGQHYSQDMTLRVLPARSAAELAAAREIRQAVFIEEQGVPAELEVDGLDPSCDHFLVFSDGEPVGTARVRQTEKGWKLERVAVLREHRGRAVGAALVAYVLRVLPAAATVYIHAQESALGFWERAGFSAEGPRFEEAGESAG